MKVKENFVLDFCKTLKSIFRKKSIYLHEPYLDKKDISSVKKSIKLNEISTSANSFYNKFNSQLKSFTKSKNIFLTSSGTNALHLALKCINLNDKDEIILSSMGFIASLNCIMYLNCTPHFIDCSKKTLGVDYEKLRSFLKKYCFINKNKECVNTFTKRKIKAIIVTHVYGYPAEIDKICKICKVYNIKVIEDAAESLGSFYKNKHLGTYGDFGILSFNGNKIITTAGGGAIIVKNKKKFGYISHIGDIARSKHEYEFYTNKLGYNYKMPNLNAALGYSQFKKISKFLKYKRNLNNTYFKKFQKFSRNLKLIRNSKKIKSNFWIQAIILNNAKLRDSIIKECYKNKIYIKPIWRPLHKSNYLKKSFCQKDLTNTNFLEKRLIGLPSGMNILKNEKK